MDINATKFPLMEITSLSPPAPSRPVKLSHFHRLRTGLERILNRGWNFELACLFSSVLIFATIVIILKFFNNTPQYPLIDMRSVITFLGTLMRGAMLFGVGSALGQLRWSWYKEHHKLIDLETFESAIDSPLGSLKLLLASEFGCV
jgi:hypothetical protein